MSRSIGRRCWPRGCRAHAASCRWAATTSIAGFARKRLRRRQPGSMTHHLGRTLRRRNCHAALGATDKACGARRTACGIGGFRTADARRLSGDRCAGTGWLAAGAAQRAAASRQSLRQAAMIRSHALSASPRLLVAGKRARRSRRGRSLRSGIRLRRLAASPCLYRNKLIRRIGSTGRVMMQY